MSTHCGISFKNEEGYHLIYVHSDGYPEYMWPMLTENYNSEELAQRLVNSGDASFIAEKLETDLPHSFDKPQHDTCCFYHRDRGEDWHEVKPEIYPHYDRNRFLNSFYYLYVFEEGCWNFYKGGKKGY
jgi:hypothetical protein